MENIHIISEKKTLLEALKQINSIAPEPLVLFVVDDQQRMVGTLTDGDSRRALVAGASVNDTVDTVMLHNFRYMTTDNVEDVNEIRHQKEMKMKLVPILDADNHIVDIINLEKYKSRLPFDAVLMAGGKGVGLKAIKRQS